MTAMTAGPHYSCTGWHARLLFPAMWNFHYGFAFDVIVSLAGAPDPHRTDWLNQGKCQFMYGSTKKMTRRLFQDFPANRGNTKAKIVVFLFRGAQLAGCLKKPWSLFGRVYLMAYALAELMLGIEIPWQVTAGRGLQIFHGHGLVIHYQAQIGKDCILRQGTTLGSAHIEEQTAPVLGDRVDVGCNVCIIGRIRIGNDVVIGAGSVVVHDVPDNAVVVGNPARVVRINEKKTRPSLSAVG